MSELVPKSRHENHAAADLLDLTLPEFDGKSRGRSQVTNAQLFCCLRHVIQ